MKADLFNEIYQAAKEQPDIDKFFNDCGCKGNAVELANIHCVANTSFRGFLKEIKLTQTECARRFAIPLRTVQNWATDTRPCPEYVKLMIAEIMGLIERG